MKKILLLTVICVIGLSIAAQDVAYSYSSNANNKRGAALWNLDTSAKRGDRQVVVGDSESTVVQKMGNPDIITNVNDGTQIWIYSQPVSRANSYASANRTAITPGPASFNQQIASNGFGQNMYTNTPITQIVPVEFDEEAVTRRTIKIKFNQNGIVENLSEIRN